jgi:hypothetical protein
MKPLRSIWAHGKSDGSNTTQLAQFSLAKQLSMALLQYHATPWLETSWNSEHILVNMKNLDSAAYQSPVSAHESYLEVGIHNPNEAPTKQLPMSARTWIHNYDLFNLGVMLLELAFQKSLREMRIDADIDSTSEFHTDYFTAHRLQSSLSRKLGTRYAEIVRQCIYCDFGHGSDLSSTKLQEGYYEDVIQGLEDIEKRLSDIFI